MAEEIITEEDVSNLCESIAYAFHNCSTRDNISTMTELVDSLREVANDADPAVGERILEALQNAFATLEDEEEEDGEEDEEEEEE